MFNFPFNQKHLKSNHKEQFEELEMQRSEQAAKQKKENNMTENNPC